MRLKRHILLFLCLLLPLFVTACNTATLSQGTDLLPFFNKTPKEVVEFDPAAGGYEDVLAWEYGKLAKYERHFSKHSRDATYFKAKAKKARRNEFVHIPFVDEYNVPDFATEELDEAREALLVALKTAHTPKNERLLAMAQTRYDCWLIHREVYPQEAAFLSCREKFYEALASLSLPDSALTLYSIYFKAGRASLTDKAKSTIGQIAKKFHNRPSWELVLSGFTDSIGDPNENKILSMRRTIAVRNTLAQHGVHFDRIVIKAEGEKGALPFVTDESARRVDVTFSPRGIYESDIREMMEDHGWGNLVEDDGEF